MLVSTVRSPRKALGHGTERRQEILDAALALYAERGVLGVSTREIAAAVGISQPALYAHFRSLNALQVEVCAQAFAELRRRQASQVDAEGATREGFLRTCRTYIDFGLEQPDAYRVAFMLEKPAADPDAHEDRVLSAGLEAFGDFRRRIERLAAARLTRPGDLTLLTQSLWAGLHGLVSLLIARPDFPWVESEALIARHLEMLADGLLSDEGLSPPR
jgi:AcrR family transcriptional regulator